MAAEWQCDGSGSARIGGGLRRQGVGRRAFSSCQRELFYQTQEGPGFPVTIMVAENETEPTFSQGPVPLSCRTGGSPLWTLTLTRH